MVLSGEIEVRWREDRRDVCKKPMPRMLTFWIKGAYLGSFNSARLSCARAGAATARISISPREAIAAPRDAMVAQLQVWCQKCVKSDESLHEEATPKHLTTTRSTTRTDSVREEEEGSEGVPSHSYHLRSGLMDTGAYHVRRTGGTRQVKVASGSLPVHFCSL